LDNKLKLLITTLETEKVNLQNCIDEYLAESEFLMAHYHRRALFQLNRQLLTLKNIDDRLYDDKMSLTSRINFLETYIKNEDVAKLTNYFSEELKNAKEELETLNQISSNNASSNSSIFNDAIDKLIGKKINKLKLILKKSNNLFFAFTYSQRTLKVSMPYLKQHIGSYIIHDENLEKLKGLGFKLADNQSKITLTLSGNKEDITNNLNQILSKIIYEVFYVKEFENESYIQFTEKSSR